MSLTGKLCGWCGQEQIYPDTYQEFEKWLAQPKGCCAGDGDGHLWVPYRFWQHDETGRFVSCRAEVDLSKTHTEITQAQYNAAQQTLAPDAVPAENTAQ
jgi:hypothetical protein